MNSPEELQLRANRRGRVPARDKIRGERIDVRADDSEFLNRVAIREDLIQHVFSIPGQGAVKKTTAGLCRIDKRQIADERGEEGRCQREPGIIRNPACCRLCRIRHNRHRFAVTTLVRWYRAGVDAERRLPILSAYLGHVHVSDTYWYLSAWPALMRAATSRLERWWEGQS